VAKSDTYKKFYTESRDKASALKKQLQTAEKRATEDKQLIEDLN
jgi:hypothetical protein